MSLPDSAEYWWDVKGYNRPSKHIFTHIEGIECGHYHVYETKDVSEIDCHACKKVLVEMPEIKEQLMVENEKEKYPNGRCSCGAAFTKRKNKSNGNEFLGCSRYPKCKNTKTLTSHTPPIRSN